MKVSELNTNPEYKTLVPPLSEEDFKNLEKSILKEGIIYPLIVNKNKTVLDGYHRLKVCKRHFITEIEVSEREFKDKLEEKEFVISCNLNRRHLTLAQRAELGLVIKGIEEEKAKKRQLSQLKQFRQSVVPKSEQRDKEIDDYYSEIYEKGKTVECKYCYQNVHIELRDGIWTCERCGAGLGPFADIFEKKDNTVTPISEERGEALEIAAKKVGLGKDTLWKAEKITEAAKEDKKIEEKWEQAKKGKTTVNVVYKEIKLKEQRERKLEPLPEDSFDIIYADPPWEYDFSVSGSRAIESHYPTMSLNEICELKIPTVENAVLFLWTPQPKLREGLKVIEAWGFEYKTGMVWVKDKMGMGYYVRGKHELLLIATKGKPEQPLPENRPESVIEAPRTKHSEKPKIIYDIIGKMYPGGKYLELFAREKHEGWGAWGNEIS